MTKNIQAIITWILLMLIGGVIGISAFYLYKRDLDPTVNVLVYDQFYLQKKGLSVKQANVLAKQYTEKGYILLKGNAIYLANKRNYLGYHQHG